ncbi:serine hydrolase domain-containing protein [Pseudogracilibacillus sp. SE30717A]|uniref:serine hydrolase domain-containing protein n=1 Tax=Pseudogracilibacillus sp. SE30717A TaxID=3098293 RepID=UPI00300DEAA7
MVCLIKETEKLITKELNKSKKASIVVGVVTKDEKIVTGTIHSENEDVDKGDYVFEIGSTTKTFTSLLLSKLVLNKTIDLDQPISAYKPEYRRALSYKGKEVTFRHLSTHLSALPRENTKKLRQRMKEHKDEKHNPYKYLSQEDFNQFFIDFDLKKEIEKKWRYSNIGVGLLGNTLAEILGLTFEEAITSQILEPLGMKDTFIKGNADQNRRYVKAYTKKGEEIPPFLVPAMNGTGALKSTVHDMLMFLEHQLNIRESPLKEEIKFTHKIHSKTQWKDFNMGLGWVIERRKWSDFPIVHHDGATIGFHTYCGFIKEKQIGTVICTTSQIRPLRLIKILLGLSGRLNEDIAKTIFNKYR